MSVDGTIRQITSANPDGARLFSTPETVAVYKNAFQNLITTENSLKFLSWQVRNICTQSPAGLNLFATKEFISAMKGVEKYVKDDEDAGYELEDCLKVLEGHLKQNPEQQ